MARAKHRTKPGGTYFITTETWQRRPIFRNSAAAGIVPKKTLEYRDRGFFLVHAYVVMPDHMHVILTPGQTTTLEKAVQLIKGGSSREIKKTLRARFPVWHTGFTEHQIVDEDDFDRHVRYIHQNPVAARLANCPEDYPFSSAGGQYALDPYPRIPGAEAQRHGGRGTAELKPRPAALKSRRKEVSSGLELGDAASSPRPENNEAGSSPKRPFRVFATCDIGRDALDVLRQRGYEVEVYDGREPPPKSLIVAKVRSGIDGLITTLRDEINAEIFEAGCGTLKVVAQDAVGFDNINRADANRYRVPFTNTADVLTEATAEFALLILGCLARKLYPSERLVRENRWAAWHPYLPFLGDEVTGKTIAIIGTGRIGQAFIKKAVGFDVHFLCYDPVFQAHEFVATIQQEMELRFHNGFTAKQRTINYVSFEEALAGGDFVSLHVPLLREGEAETPTFHMINEKTLRLMKSTAYLINTSRGPVVDEQALVAALKEGVIAGAALDVFETEPLPPDSPLRDPALEERLRLFHHFASGGRITRLSTNPDLGMAGRTVQALIDVLEGNYGGNPASMPYVVNKEAFR